MDSINIAKGYGKVSSLENPTATTHHHRQNAPSACRKRLIAIVIASIIILSIVIAAAVVALIHESITEGPEEDEQPKNSPNPSNSDSIHTVCTFTQFPDSCFKSISNLSITPTQKFDPEIIYSLSLKAAIEELVNLTSFPNTLIHKYNRTEPKTVSALNDCVELFADGLSQLRNSEEAMKGNNGTAIAMTELAMENMKTWTSAAMTDLDTCIDGLEEMESTVVDEVKMRVQKSKEYMSNSLAILSNMKAILDRFHLKLH
ncbi:pectinesterase 3 [Impatiens glandulifera]|uniref:pectinesterase 3 n=1 Tax=Impatiens glandulifera TaxID=253017 RepID=UPI001FB0CB4F|nr:pectinesterase 3 [Impatiens glandulifera]